MESTTQHPSLDCDALVVGAGWAGMYALLKLRELGTVGSLMMTTAHPDDENNALLARFKYERGMRTTLGRNESIATM